MSGPVGFVLFGIGIWPLAGFLPPIAPSLSADAVSAIYQDHMIGIRLGAMIVMLGAALFAPFFAQISVLMKRIEGEHAPYAVTQAVSAAMVILCFFVGAMMFTMTAFRPDRAAELTLAMNDAAWIMFITPAAPAFVQTLAIGFAILSDKRAVPLLPRWSGYFSLWVAVLFLPGALAMMFKTGPFAWNGILAFWVPVVLVGTWSITMSVLMIKALKKSD